MRTICIYGSARVLEGSSDYVTAEGIGRGLAQAGYAVMNGGYYGIMEAVSKGAKGAGGIVIGVTTDQIGKTFDLRPNRYLGEHVHFVRLHDRLRYMVEHADGYLALPGGVGTWHEIAETWEAMRIGAIPRRPFVCYGTMWRSIIGQLQDSEYCSDGYRKLIHFVQSPGELWDFFPSL